MLFVVLKGGMVTLVTTDDPKLKNRLNAEGGVAIVDYDTDGADDDELVNVRVKQENGTLKSYEAIGHLEEVGDANISAKALLKELRG